jgi:hypothetical protein
MVFTNHVPNIFFLEAMLKVIKNGSLLNFVYYMYEQILIFISAIYEFFFVREVFNFFSICYQILFVRQEFIKNYLNSYFTSIKHTSTVFFNHPSILNDLFLSSALEILPIIENKNNISLFAIKNFFLQKLNEQNPLLSRSYKTVNSHFQFTDFYAIIFNFFYFMY